MKLELIDTQIDLILKSLENYTKIEPKKIQLIYTTYESLLNQKTLFLSKKCNINVMKMIYKNRWQIGYLYI